MLYFYHLFLLQVGHHPPVSAFHADSRNTDTSEGSASDSPPDFVFHGSVYPKPKFWGKSVEFQPKVQRGWQEKCSCVTCTARKVLLRSGSDD